MSSAFLAVLSSPSSSLPLEEFHDWYNNEHVPLRLEQLNEFTAGARYFALPDEESADKVSSDDPYNPQWLAVYTLTSMDIFNSPAYTRLRDERSEREKGVFARLGVLGRMCGEIVDVFEREGETSMTGFNLPEPTKWVITHGCVLEDRGVDEVVIRVLDVLRKTTGWIRTTAGRVTEHGVVGIWAQAKEVGRSQGKSIGGAEPTGSLFFVHGAHPAAVRTPTDRSAIEMERKEDALKALKRLQENLREARSVRAWELYRAYECLWQKEAK